MITLKFCTNSNLLDWKWKIVCVLYWVEINGLIIKNVLNLINLNILIVTILVNVKKNSSARLSNTHKIDNSFSYEYLSKKYMYDHCIAHTRLTDIIIFSQWKNVTSVFILTIRIQDNPWIAFWSLCFPRRLRGTVLTQHFTTTFDGGKKDGQQRNHLIKRLIIKIGISFEILGLRNLNVWWSPMTDAS